MGTFCSEWKAQVLNILNSREGSREKNELMKKTDYQGLYT